MRILHLTTSFSGGAGIAARRICEAQNNYGLDSVIMGIQVTDRAEQNINEISYNRNLKSKLISTIITGAQQKIFQSGDELLTPISISTLKISDSLYKDFDLIHIHAFYNLLSIKQIAQIFKKIPAIITMHDQRLFTGGCHYSFDCQGFKTNCSDCPQATAPFKFVTKLSLRNSIKLLKTHEKITYVTPSSWLADCAIQSNLLQNQTIHTIANPIPDIYKSVSEYQNNSLRFTIGFFSHDLNNPYKGLETLISAAHILKHKLPIELKFYGRGEILQDMTDLIYSRSYFKDDVSAVKAYNSCDIVVVPSTQDNSPSVITEALMCGVPVVSTNVGGIREVLNKFNLPIIEPRNPRILAETLINFSKKDSIYNISNVAKKIFSYESSSTRHLQIYENALANFKDNSIN